ncbi:MAG: transposase, partial [Candidatus Nitrotoga sp.]|nr:transposase [Candidatus Nitrotoga sp.]MDP1855454.1 transposase [Candidatus Nitrotoga sp.]
IYALWVIQSSDNSRLEIGACLDMKNIGKPCAGKLHARFDEGGQARDCSLTLPEVSLGLPVLKLKTPYRDGTTHIVMSPLEFMQRLAALVPRPRLNLIRFNGVLAPNAKLRAEIIPDGMKSKSKPTDANDDVPQSTTSVCISWARLLMLKRVFDIDIEHCPHCGGTLKIIAAILESGAITKILDHLGLSARAPPRSPAQAFELFEPI